ncbi:hypothetical protein GCM10009603_14940 [Nocardiopsis exhalans]
MALENTHRTLGGPDFMQLRGRLVHRIVPNDLGKRVSVRITHPEGGFTDIVGVVESWAEGVLTLRRRDDSTVEVREADIVASRVVPPVPPRRRDGRPPQAP